MRPVGGRKKFIAAASRRKSYDKKERRAHKLLNCAHKLKISSINRLSVCFLSATPFEGLSRFCVENAVFCQIIKRTAVIMRNKFNRGDKCIAN